MMNYIITTENFEKMVRLYCLAIKQTTYNSVCFGSSDVRRHYFCYDRLYEFMAMIEAVGYEAGTIIQRYTVEYGFGEEGYTPITKGLKANLDDSFRLDVSSHSDHLERWHGVQQYLENEKENNDDNRLVEV